MHTHDHDFGPCGPDMRAHHGRSGHGFKPPFGMMAAHMQGFAAHGGGRARRGDIRAAVLRLLSEAPMHGYQIIQELSARSEGAWSPSPGSVYPTLQLLADEGLVTSEESGGKKVFRLTEAGTATVAEMADQPAPWEQAAIGGIGSSEYRQAAGKLAQAMFQIGKGGSALQVAAATEVITDARKKLYAILAED